MPVADDTKDFLEQVRKGKSRKFVLLTKGTSIVSLVLFKKGTPSKFIKQAKEEGKGIPCHGVVEGRGIDITFKLSVDDGFTDPPVKDLILKKYLEEEAGFKCKPSFEIVETLPIVLDDADPLHARFLKLQVTVARAIDADPTREQKLSTLCRQIGSYLDADQRKQAEEKLAVLEAELAGSESTEQSKLRGKFEAARLKLEPIFNKGKKLAPDKAATLTKIWDYADAQAAAGNFKVANQAMTGLVDALKRIAAAPKQTDAQRFGISENIVADRKRFLAARWQRALDDVWDELANLQAGIESNLPDVKAAAVVAGIDRWLTKFYGDVSDVVAGVGAATSADTSPLDRALQTVRRFKQLVPTQPQIVELRRTQSELGVAVDVEGKLLSALAEMEATFQA